jgi:hypothetical protein
VGKPERKRPLARPRHIDGRLILRCVFRKWDVGAWTGLSWHRVRQVAGTYECGNELAGSIKYGEFLD